MSVSTLFGLVALLPLAACGPKSKPPSPPNVLLISIDTLRADHLSCYGYPRPTSPRLDALAAQGTLFADCCSSSSWTLPSHLTMLTGLPVSAHGICDDRLWTRQDPDGRSLPVELHGAFLPELLFGAGYRTGGFYTWKYLEPKFGFGPGFEVYQRLGHTFYSFPPVAREFERLRAAKDVEALKALAAEHPELFDSDRPSSPETIERALAWIDDVRKESPESPFFCFVHLFDVHDPYRPPAPFDTRFTDPAYEGLIDGRNVTSPDSAVRAEMSAEDLEQLIALYDGGIAYVDSQVGTLLDALEARGLDEDTLVIVTSDHGEEFFEHGNKTHRRTLYRESVHVPLLVRWPAGLPAGRRVEQAVGLVDLAPTVASLCGLGPPPGSIGRDLSSALREEQSGDAPVYLSELQLFDDGAVPRRLLGLRIGRESAILSAHGTAAWEVEQFGRDAPQGEAGEGLRFDWNDPRARPWRERLRGVREDLEFARQRAPVHLSSELGGLDALDLAELTAMGYTGVETESGRRRGNSGQSPRLCLDGCVWPDE